MGEYEINGRNGSPWLFQIKGDTPSPTEMARINAALSQADQPEQAAPAPKEEAPGIMTTLGHGLARGWNEIQAGVDTAGQSMFEGLGDAARAKEWEQAAKAQRAEGNQYELPGGSFLDPNTSQTAVLAGTIGESAPSMALGYGGMAAGGYAGAAIGSVLGPVGTVAGGVIGGAIGGALGYAPQMLNSNAERQIEQFGYVKDWGKAYAATGLQAGIETATDKIGLRIIAGLGKAGKAVGKTFLNPATETAVKEATDISIKKAMTIVAKKIGEGAAFHAVSGATEEVLQQGMERWQAELPLMDDQAKKEYLESAIVGGIVESIFGIGEGTFGGIHEVKKAKSEWDAEEHARAEAAALGSDANRFGAEWEQKRKGGYSEPPAPAEEDPTIDGAPPPNDFVEDVLPPGLRDLQAGIKPEDAVETQERRKQNAKRPINPARFKNLQKLGYTEDDIYAMSDEEIASTVTPPPSAPPPSAPSSPQAVPERVGKNGMRLVHGSGDAALTQQRVEIIRSKGQKQGKKGRIYGGFYTHAEEDVAHAENYSRMMGGTPTVYNVDIHPDTIIHRMDGDITRLTQQKIDELLKQNVGVVAGTDPRGRTEYAIIQKNAIKDMTPRVSTTASEQATATPGGIIPFVMTKAMRKSLGEMGYTPKQIREMTPQQAHDIINKPVAGASETTQPGPAPKVAAEPDLVAPNATSEATSEGTIGPNTRPYSETEYRSAVDSLRDEGTLSIDKIAKTLGVSKPMAISYFNEMLHRGDAHAAGNKGQYAKVVAANNTAPKKQSGRPTTRRSREYVVRPMASADARPHYVEVNGQKVGDRFTTTEEAQAWIDQHVPVADKGKATVGQDNAGTEFGVHEVQYEHTPGKDQRQINERLVSVHNNEQEANAARDDHDPAYSPETNRFGQKKATEEREAKTQADFVREMGPIAAKLGAYNEKVLGQGRVDLGILPRITNPAAPDAIVEGVSQNVYRTDPDGMKRVIGNLIRLASDLYNPSLSVEERARLMQSVLNHELIHALRSLDLLTPQEWDTLYQHAVSAKVPGKTFTWMQLAVARTKGSGISPHALVEESIAEMARHYMDNPTAFRNPQRSMLQKIAQFIKKMMRLAQRNDAADLMDTIFSGGVADRQIGHGGLGPRGADDVRFSLLKPDNFYLKTSRFLDGVTREQAPKNDWIKMLSSAGIKDEELKWLGIKDWLQNLPKGEMVHRNDIINYVKASGPKVDTIVFADRDHPDLKDAAVSAPRWGGKSQTRDDSSYAEVAFTFPEQNDQPTYWDSNGHIMVRTTDEATGFASNKKVPNVLAFARFRDAFENGKRILFIEEIQSDLHQQGSMKGYYSKTFVAKMQEAQQQARDAWQEHKALEDKKIALNDEGWMADRTWERWELENIATTEQRRAHRQNQQRIHAEYQQASEASDAAKKRFHELQQVALDAQTRQMIPNAPFKSNWEDYVIRRMIRHAAEHGYDGIAWHGSPESVAETEGYGEIEAGVDERGKPTYTAYGGQAQVSPIINRYLLKLPKIADALGGPFGVNLDKQPGKGLTASEAPEEWGQAENQHPYSEATGGREQPLLQMIDEIMSMHNKAVFNKVASDIIYAHQQMVQKEHYLIEDDKRLGQTLADKMKMARQINNNRRQYDAVSALHDAGINSTELRHILNWWKSDDFYDARPGPATAGNVKGSATAFDHYRMMFNSAMTESFEKGDQPFFSMVRERKDQIVADPNFQKWFGQSTVVDDDGSPLVVYHGTRVPEKFGAFNQVSHFGTPQAANDRLTQERGRDEDWDDEEGFEGLDVDSLSDEEIDRILLEREMKERIPPVDEHERIYPVFLNLQRPLRIDDNGLTEGDDYAQAALDAEAITPKEFDSVTNAMYSSEVMAKLIPLLEKKGYDGFVYENAQEDPGSTSYTAFHSNQVKSVFNPGLWSNDPDTMYSQIRDSIDAEDKRGWRSGRPDTLYSMVDARKQKIMASPNFQKWFKNGAVTERDGVTPLTVYHATQYEKEISTFYRMTHWGSRDAANDRLLGNWPQYASGETLMEKLGVYDPDEQARFWAALSPDERTMMFDNYYKARDKAMTEKPSRIYPAFLNIQNPLEIYDTGVEHTAFDYITAAAAEGALTHGEATMLRGLTHALGNTFGVGQFIRIIEKKGYDGLKYTNNVEGAGTLSYVTFRPNQIKSIFNPDRWGSGGDMMYSQLQDRGADLKENNDKFQTWFNGSRVTKENGDPILLFHGTSKDNDFNTFKTGQRGVWFIDDPLAASSYAEENDSQKIVPDTASRDPWALKRVHTASRVVPVFLSIKNPYLFNGEEMENWLRDPRNSNYARAQRDLFNNLRNNGYDGVKWGDNVWVAFQPGQIKSALATEFSTDSDSFKYSQVVPPQYSATAPPGQRVPAQPPIDQLAEVHNRLTYDNLSPVLHKLIDWTIPGSRNKAVWKGGADDTIISLQDRMLPVGRLIDRIKKNGGFISNENDVYLRETLYSSQTDAHLTANDRDFYKPMLDSIQKLTVTKNDYNEARNISPRVADFLDGYKVNWKHALSELYLYARHAQERNAVMQQRNERVAGERPMQYEAGSGMGNGEAQAVLDWFDSKPFGREFSDLRNPASIRSRMRAIIASTNDVRVAGGLNPDFRTLLHPDGTPVFNYEDYVPIRGFLGEASLRDEDMTDFAKTGKGFNIRGKEDYSALGRESMGRDIIAHAIMQNQESVVRAGKNKVTQSFRQLILDNAAEMNDVAEILQMPRTTYTFDRKAGVVREVVDNSVQTDPTILKGKVNGQQFYIKLKDPRLVKAMGSKSGLGSNTGMHGLIKGLAKVNRILAATRTSYNPEFMIANMLRDMQAALINLSEADQKGVRRQVIASVFPALKGVRDSLRSGNPTGEWARIHEEFRRHGGHTAVFGIRELADTIDKMNAHFAEDVSGPVVKVKQPLRWLGKFIEDYNLAIENGTRLAAYKTLRDKYLELSGDPNNPQNQLRAKEMAAFAAKNLTVNFNMGGESKSLLSAFYMFFNASMQGSMALLNPFIRSRKMKYIWASVLTAGALQDLLMSLLSPDDKDGEKQYDKIPDYVLEHNMVFMDPFGLSKRGYFKIPMPYLMNGIYNWGRAAAKTARGKSSFGELMSSGGMTMIDSLNPWGGSNSFLNFVAPSIIDPVVDLYMNEDFTGKPIAPPVSPYDNLGENRSQQFWNNTNPAYVTIADWMSRLTGREGDYIPGKMEYSPNQVEYVADFITGGTGTFVARAARLMYGGVTGDLPNMDISASDVPFARKAYGSITQKNDLQDYVQSRDQVLRIRKALHDARKDGDNDTYMKIMRDYPKEYKIAAKINAIENARKKIGGQIKKIRDNERLSDEIKAAMIKRKKDRQDELVGRGNEVMTAID